MSGKEFNWRSKKHLSFSGASSRFLCQLMGPFWQNSLTILIYHRVLATQDPLRQGEPSVLEFDHEVELISSYFTPIPLTHALKAMGRGNLPKRAVCVTFDDGYADNEKLALPILEKYEVPATVFVSSAYLDGGRMWNDTVIETVRMLGGKDVDLECFEMPTVKIDSLADKRMAVDKIIRNIKHWDHRKRQASVDQFQSKVHNLPDDLMLTTGQLRNLHSRGIDIGGHTLTHPILNSLSLVEATREIAGCKEDLEMRIRGKVGSFAYPNGRPNLDFRDCHVKMVRDAGYSCAVTTKIGNCKASTDRYQLPRFTPWNKTRFGFTRQMMANALGLYSD